MASDLDKYYSQIDILKSLAIIAVIVLHTVPVEFLVNSYAIFHIWQAVPIFLVIIGVTLSLSYDKYDYTSIGQYYSKDNILHRCNRILPAFAVTFLVALVSGVARGEYYWGWKTYLGFLPISSPGNYFLSLILQLLIIAPLMVYFYRKHPTLSIIIFFALNLIFELLSPYVFNGDRYLYYSCLFRVLAIVSVGLYLGSKLASGQLSNISRNRFIQIGVLFSIIYLIVSVACGWKLPLFLEPMETQYLLYLFYPVLIVVIVLNIKLDYFKDDAIFRLCVLIGRASYHIFLAQMLYFGLRYGSYAPSGFPLLKAILINLGFTIVAGIVFYRGEQLVGRAWSMIRCKKGYQIEWKSYF